MKATGIALDLDGNPTRFDWPVDPQGNPNVPRVDDDVVTPDGNYVVHSVHWNPLGDEDNPEPFVVIIMRSRL